VAGGTSLLVQLFFYVLNRFLLLKHFAIDLMGSTCCIWWLYFCFL